MPVAPDHPVLAVIAPPRLDRFRARFDLGPDDRIEADFTGWSKLVLLTARHALLFPRDETQVEALQREATALEALAALEIPGVPRLLEVVEDPGLSAHPILVEERLPGVPLSGVLDRVDADVLGRCFAELGRRAAAWHLDAHDAPGLPRRDAMADTSTLETELQLPPALARAASLARDRAHELDPVLVHGDLHEGQLLVDPDQPFELRGILDWQTARIDHPFVEFDLGEWGTALWRRHRASFPALRRRAWTAYAEARGLPADLEPVFEWHHATTHARRLLGARAFPVAHGPDVVGTLDEARQRVIEALTVLASTP